MRLLLPNGSVMNDKAKKVGLVLQGGGALGAYEAGAIKRIYELGYRPEILTGTSIGALNAAVLAAPLYGEAHETLLEMWDYLGHEHPFPLFQNYNTAYTSLGHPRFFKLHGTLFGMGRRPSIYDISPALETMQRYIDFDRLNAPEAPTVVVTATNVVSGETERFSNRTHTLTPEHIMASGALPPSFPPIEIDGEHYWDGGIYDNTPIQSLVRILNEHETAHLPIFVIELFGALGDVPKDLGQSIDRMTELVYEDKFWKTFEGHDKAYEFAEMLWDLEQDLPEDSPLRERDTFKSRVFLGCGIVLFCIQFAMLGQVVYGAVFIQNVLAFSPFQTGLSMMPVVLTIIVMAQVSGYLFDKVPFRLLAVAGTLAISVGFFSQAVVLEQNNIIWLVPGMMLIGFGLGLLASTVTTEGLSHVSQTQRATASAILQTLRQTGGVFGIACIGSVINLIEKDRISMVAEKLEPLADKRYDLQVLLFQSEQAQATATDQLRAHWPRALDELKDITTEAIAAGYYLGAGVVLLAAIFSIWSFSQKGEPEIAPDTLEQD